ncbi:MAG TPA: flagellar biosynthetic protein FliO [Kofleriaceae bacterium]|jgi:flagellar biogenesis protein FliO|nr:flagellar biosynthetic protein FliO [Kofleriaceae bacterium]
MAGTGAAGASYGDLLVTSLLVLGGVCVAAFVVVRLLGRLLSTGRARGAHLLDVIARLPLEPRRSLYVVQVAGKTLLVGTSEMGLSVLSELDAGEVRTRTQVADRPSFGELVRTAWLRRRSAAPLQGSVDSAVEPHAERRAPRSDAPGAPGPAPAVAVATADRSSVSVPRSPRAGAAAAAEVPAAADPSAAALSTAEPAAEVSSAEVSSAVALSSAALSSSEPSSAEPSAEAFGP